MSNYAEVIIEPKELVNRMVLQKNIELERSYEVLLTGTVYNIDYVPIEGAVIEVFAMYSPNYSVKKGYVITNHQGEFAIVVEKNDYIDYLLYIYEPLINETKDDRCES